MSIPTLNGIPASIDSTVSAAASTYNSNMTEANRLAYVQALNYQYSLNIPLVEADLQSLADQLEVAKGVLGRLQQLGTTTNQGENCGSFTVDAMNAALASDQAWTKTRGAAIQAAIDAQVETIVSAMP